MQRRILNFWFVFLLFAVLLITINLKHYLQLLFLHYAIFNKQYYSFWLTMFVGMMCKACANAAHSVWFK